METTVGTIDERYELLNKKGEGTFSEVLMCIRRSDGLKCAVKRMKGKYSSLEQVNNLREVQALRRLNPHHNIVQLIDIVYDPKVKTLDLVFELMEMNIYEKIKHRKRPLAEMLVKSFMYQLLKALEHMHKNGVFHRDVKPENVLLQDTVLKLADFGSCRGIYSKPPYTEYISTRWYRSPECLLTDGYYSYKMDIWSVGCVMFEVLSLSPLFPGKNELDQINRIHNILGTPTPSVVNKIRKDSQHMKLDFPEKRGVGLRGVMPGASDALLDLMTGMLQYDPEMRMSARQAVRHTYFKDVRDREKMLQDDHRIPDNSVDAAVPAQSPRHRTHKAGPAVRWAAAITTRRRAPDSGHRMLRRPGCPRQRVAPGEGVVRRRTAIAELRGTRLGLLVTVCIAAAGAGM